MLHPYKRELMDVNKKCNLGKPHVSLCLIPLKTLKVRIHLQKYVLLRRRDFLSFFPRHITLYTFTHNSKDTTSYFPVDCIIMLMLTKISNECNTAACVQ